MSKQPQQPKLIQRLNATETDDETSFLIPMSEQSSYLGRRNSFKDMYSEYIQDLAWYIEVFSAGLIALLLNLLDVIAYGRIIFPIIPSTIGRASVAMPNTMIMYILTSVIAQLCFSAFSSFDRGVLAGMMVEVIPFYHSYFWSIYHSLTINESFLADLSSLYPTLFFMILLSSATISFLFFVIGFSSLSKLLQYFPRQVIYGCMGAIGYFLSVTGIDIIISGLDPFDNSGKHWSFKKFSLIEKLGLVLSSYVSICVFGIALFSALVAAVFSRHRITSGNPFIIPMICVLLILGFYGTIYFSDYSVSSARHDGWILISPNEEANTKEGFWDMFYFYNYFLSPSKIDWSLVPGLFPTFLGMITFALINVPINVPAFAAATNQSPSLRRELKLHGLSNICGFFGGGLANYFIFSNSLLFFQSGGKLTRHAGYLVVVLTLSSILFIYYDVFDFLPKFVPVFLVFYLTIELFWEAFVKSHHFIYDKRELFTILVIVVISSFVGFSEGLFIGLGLTFLDIVLKLAEVPISVSDFPPLTLSADVTVLKIGGYLFFGNFEQIIEIFLQIIPLLESNETTTLILDLRGLLGWDLTYQLEFKNLTQHYKTLLSHPSVTWLMLGSKNHIPFLTRAGWLECSHQDLIARRQGSPDTDEIYFQYISSLMELDLALSHQNEQVANLASSSIIFSEQ